MLRCPTSELPICPRGRPTARPEASSVVHALSRNSRSKRGVSASAIAFDSVSFRQPKPSRTMRMRNGRSGIAARDHIKNAEILSHSPHPTPHSLETATLSPLAFSTWEGRTHEDLGVQDHQRPVGELLDGSAACRGVEPARRRRLGARQHHLDQLQDRRNRSHRHGLQTREAAASRVTATVPGNAIGVNSMAKKILLADDSITIQKVVELTFSDGDYEVTAVNNGAKAIQKLADMRPDIILSDIIMPEKNGYEVCEYVKSHPEYRNIPVILLTGTFEPFDPDRADKAGCDAVVTKPFESQSLIHKVEELVEASRNMAASEPEPAPVPEPAAFAADTSPWAEPEPAPAPAPEPFAHDA